MVLRGGNPRGRGPRRGDGRRAPAPPARHGALRQAWVPVRRARAATPPPRAQLRAGALRAGPRRPRRWAPRAATPAAAVVEVVVPGHAFTLRFDVAEGPAGLPGNCVYVPKLRNGDGSLIGSATLPVFDGLDRYLGSLRGRVLLQLLEKVGGRADALALPPHAQELATLLEANHPLRLPVRFIAIVADPLQGDDEGVVAQLRVDEGHSAENPRVDPAADGVAMAQAGGVRVEAAAGVDADVHRDGDPAIANVLGDQQQDAGADAALGEAAAQALVHADGAAGLDIVVEPQVGDIVEAPPAVAAPEDIGAAADVPPAGAAALQEVVAEAAFLDAQLGDLYQRMEEKHLNVQRLVQQMDDVAAEAARVNDRKGAAKAITTLENTAFKVVSSYAIQEEQARNLRLQQTMLGVPTTEPPPILDRSPSQYLRRRR